VDRVLDLSAFAGKVGYVRGSVVVVPETESEGTRVPLADLGVVLVGLKTSLSGAVLHQCADFDVVVLVCDWRGVPVSGAFPWSHHTRVGARQLAQTSASLPRKKNAWARIVRAKIDGQRANLALHSPAAAQALAGVRRSVRSGDPDNAEARAARLYWPKVFGDTTFVREPGAGSGLNGLLDYGYAILRGFGIRAVLSAGLAPAIGLFHRGRSNPFNLVDDLIEPFRPAVDWTVASLPSDAAVNHPSVKQELVRATTGPFGVDGHSAATELTTLAQALGKYFEGDTDVLPVPAWSPRPPTDDLNG